MAEKMLSVLQPDISIEAKLACTCSIGTSLSLFKEVFSASNKRVDVSWKGGTESGAGKLDIDAVSACSGTQQW